MKESGVGGDREENREKGDCTKGGPELRRQDPSAQPHADYWGGRQQGPLHLRQERQKGHGVTTEANISHTHELCRAIKPL